VTMNSTAFCVVTLCSLVEVQWYFEGFCLLPACYWFLAWLTLQPWRWRQYIPLKCQWTYTKLHSIETWKTYTLHSHTMSSRSFLDLGSGCFSLLSCKQMAAICPSVFTLDQRMHFICQKIWNKSKHTKTNRDLLAFKCSCEGGQGAT
jgi:hypothetical protein